MKNEIKSPVEILKNAGITSSTKYHNYDYLYKQTVLSIEKYHAQFESIQTDDIWISVDKELPTGFWADTEQEHYKKFSQLVNVVIDNGTVGTAAYNRETKKWFLGDLSEKRYQEFDRTKVTHWRELPVGPLMVNEETPV